MYKWALELSYVNAAGDKISSWLPVFDSFADCAKWEVMITDHILQYNHVTEVVSKCVWFAT